MDLMSFPPPNFRYEIIRFFCKNFPFSKWLKIRERIKDLWPSGQLKCSPQVRKPRKLKQLYQLRFMFVSNFVLQIVVINSSEKCSGCFDYQFLEELHIRDELQLRNALCPNAGSQPHVCFVLKQHIYYILWLQKSINIWRLEKDPSIMKQ